MAAYRLQVILATSDNVPENFITNTYCIDTDLNETKRDLIVAAVKELYDTLRPSHLSDLIAQNGHRVKFTELVGTPPIYPTYDVTWNLDSAPTGASLPSEVAMVASFQGARISGEPQRRRRGRVYIGPLKSAILDNGRPTLSSYQALAVAMSAFGIDINNVADTSWCVWSAVDQEAVPITDGWVDNSFDTQRRRGVQTTARQNYFV